MPCTWGVIEQKEREEGLRREEDAMSRTEGVAKCKYRMPLIFK
jgi:hypothetical protein